MNIEDLNTFHFCTSCQMCGAVCPHDAISIQLNMDGFYRPVVDKEKCVDCSLCTKVCYKYDDHVTLTSTESLSSIPVFAAKCKNKDVLPDVTSGGVADVLCELLVSTGYTCVGVTYDLKKDVAVSKLANNRKETLEFRGSKYIQSYTFDAFKELVSQKFSKKYAVFGTPCHIYAVNKYLERIGKRNNVVLIDVFCHGCPSMNIWKKYIGRIRSNVGRIDTVKFRSKYRGWGSFCVSTERDKKTIYSGKRINDDFYSLFFSDLALNDACGDCKLRSTFDYTDLRLGDFWGKQYDYNKTGVSLVVPVTPKGQEVFNAISENLNTKKHIHQDYLPYQSYGRNYVVNENQRRNLFRIINDDNTSLEMAVDYYFRTQPLKKKIKRHLKNIVLLMPNNIVSVVKKVYHF